MEVARILNERLANFFEGTDGKNFRLFKGPCSFCGYSAVCSTKASIGNTYNQIGMAVF